MDFYPQNISTWWRKHTEADWEEISGEFAIVCVNCVHTTPVCGMVKTWLFLLCYSRSLTSNCSSFLVFLFMMLPKALGVCITERISSSPRTSVHQNDHYTLGTPPDQAAYMPTWASLLYMPPTCTIPHGPPHQAPHCGGTLCLVGMAFFNCPPTKTHHLNCSFCWCEIQ